MKLHRFYVGGLNLDEGIQLKDARLHHQITRVLRYRVDQQLALFNSDEQERLYKILEMSKESIHLKFIADVEPKRPSRTVYLCFSGLKKDKNDWVLQKATELGVRHFVPLISDRTEKTGFDVERAEKIAMEAAEQCGRVDIPRIREPVAVETIIDELSGKVDIYVADERNTDSHSKYDESDSVVLIGPEGGWSQREVNLFKAKGLRTISLGMFTLRAETAAVVASYKLLND